MLRARAHFYHQLRHLITAGVELGRGLELAGEGGGRPYRDWAPRLAAGCRSGQALGEQLLAIGEDPVVAALITAGERSGALPAMCSEIETISEHAIATRRLVIGRALYPLLLLHAALMLPGVVLLVLGRGGILGVIGGPLLLWAALALVWVLGRVTRGGRLRGRLALSAPIAALTVHRCAADCCLVLHAAARAGMLWPDALHLAADATGNAIWRERLHQAADDIEQGRLPDLPAALTRVGLPRETLSLIATGEASGETEATLARCAAFERERYHERVTWTARIVMGLVYGAIIVVAAITIIGMYAGYVNTLTGLAEG